MVICHIDMVILDERYEIWAHDMGDDSIDTVILDIDMGYCVTLPVGPPLQPPRYCAPLRGQGLTLIPISAQLELTFPMSAQLRLTFPTSAQLKLTLSPI